jgi:3-dehydro-L-gulonate 2-dehydrogenase
MFMRGPSGWQMFIVIDPRGDHDALADRVIAHLHAGEGVIRYPGERTLETRARNLREGVPADPAIWRQVQALAAG